MYLRPFLLSLATLHVCLANDVVIDWVKDINVESFINVWWEVLFVTEPAVQALFGESYERLSTHLQEGTPSTHAGVSSQDHKPYLQVRVVKDIAGRARNQDTDSVKNTLIVAASAMSNSGSDFAHRTTWNIGTTAGAESQFTPIMGVRRKQNRLMSWLNKHILRQNETFDVYDELILMMHPPDGQMGLVYLLHPYHPPISDTEIQEHIAPYVQEIRDLMKDMGDQEVEEDASAGNVSQSEWSPFWRTLSIGRSQYLYYNARDILNDPDMWVTFGSG